jgi:hypothetical protein
MNKMEFQGLTQSSINSGLVVGTTTTFTMPAATSCAFRGKWGTPLGIVGSNSGTTPTTDATTGAAFVAVLADYCAALVWGVNAAGTIKLAQGPVTPLQPGPGTTVGAFINAPLWPAMVEDFCPIAYQLVRVSPTGASFTAGTTQWAASGITCSTIQNVNTLPDRPQIT